MRAIRFSNIGAHGCVHSFLPFARQTTFQDRVTIRYSCNQQQQENLSTVAVEPAAQAKEYYWKFDGKSSASRDNGRQIMDLPVAAIRRPLGRTRKNDQQKVAALMESIQEIGLQEPVGTCMEIDVLEVEGVYYGFSGCHRFEAHQRLGAETIRCRVRKATKEVLKMHLM